MLIIPGVTGCSTDPYIKDLAGISQNSGFNPVVINCLASKDEVFD
jgi:predicted alpha/beta-fold hydrolase